ncbi:MAG: tetratricopeptide repeat protein [Phycisphaerae bacterium]
MKSDIQLPTRTPTVPASLPRVLLVCAVVILVATSFATGLGLAVRMHSSLPVDASFVARGLMDLGLGVALAGIVFAVSRLARAAVVLRSGFSRLERLAADLRSVPTVSPVLPPETGDAEASGAAALDDDDRRRLSALQATCDEMLALLRDIRDTSLLSDAERREKAARVEQLDAARIRTQVESLAAGGEFERAVQQIGEFERRFPGRPLPAELRAGVEQRRTERKAADTRDFSRRVDEFINISAWQRAREVVAELRRRYPDTPAAAPLAARIEREYELYEDAQHRQMYAEIQRFVARKRWREALVAAETFIERFPLRPESEALKLQLRTLSGNADVAARQDMEAEITELARQGQYAEAKALAERLIQRWPETVQAEILRSQLDRLHELATNPKAPPPRVRPNPAG